MKLSAFPMLHLVRALNLSKKKIEYTRRKEEKHPFKKCHSPLGHVGAVLAPGNIKTSWDTCQIHGLIPVFQD